MRTLKLILAVVVAVLLVIVVLQNTATVEAQLLIRPVRMPLAAMLFGTLLVGFLLGFLATTWLVRRSHKRKDQ